MSLTKADYSVVVSENIIKTSITCTASYPGTLIILASPRLHVKRFQNLKFHKKEHFGREIIFNKTVGILLLIYIGYITSDQHARSRVNFKELTARNNAMCTREQIYFNFIIYFIFYYFVLPIIYKYVCMCVFYYTCDLQGSAVVRSCATYKIRLHRVLKTSKTDFAKDLTRLRIKTLDRYILRCTH
jgi:hypothetical protein